MLSISELKSKWNKEKESYQVKEVGSGVQKFVKDFLKSKDFFNLKEGLESAALENRKNEFTEESKTKAARKADIIIYINQDIIIPVEVEKYGNIKSGLEQLFQYQLDLDKKYGILTDGYTWQFYNNAYLLKEFTLEQIFNQSDLFQEFWQEYIKPEFYYLSFFEEKGQLKILPEDLSAGLRRQDFFRDITTLIRGFEKKLDIEGYFAELGKKEKAKKAVEITYAYIIQFILYKTLVDNEFDDFAKNFADINDAISDCLKQKQYGRILGLIDGISNGISKNIYRPFAKEQEFITKTVLELIRSPKNELHEVSPWLDIFVFIKKYNFANVKNEIFGYIYENYLKELYEETQKGQYFTDPAVVNFMLEQVGYNEAEIKKRLNNEPDEDYISLIDPSCGSGTFLYSATDKIINAVPDGSLSASKKVEKLVDNNVFGLDIAEFPLYLAEMNILMRLLPLIINSKYNNPIDKKIKVFLTKDSVAEFIDTGLKNTINDIDVAGGQQSLFITKKLDLGYKSYVRDEGDLAETKQSMRPPRRRFDYVIGNPPYIGYNECSKQKVLIVKLIQDKKVQMSDIYGVNLNTVPERNKAYAPKPNLYAFFIALGIALLKDSGKLCYIIPQTLLTAGDLDVVRYHLSKFTTIEKIITFGGKMFVGRGLEQNKPVATSSLIFVLRKNRADDLHQVEVINYLKTDDDVEECLNNIRQNKKISKKKILQNKLLQNIANWNFIRQDEVTIEFFDHYNRNENFNVYRIPELSKPKFNSVFYFDKGLVFPKNKLIDTSMAKADDDYFYMIEVDKNKYRLSLNNTIILKSDIRFPKGSQGIEVYEKKYKIVWSYMNANRFYFTDEKVMLSFNWVLISGNNSNEMLYILSLLNSNLNRFVFSSLLKNENEKDFLIGIKTIKEFVRIPKITGDNQFVKDEVIKIAEELLKLEEWHLSDLVDFSGIMAQKIDSIRMGKESLILTKDDKEIECKIKTNSALVEKVIKANFASDKLFKERINLPELKNLSAIDLEKQKQIKDYIDDLIFALYFSIFLEKLGLNNAAIIKSKCAKNPFYKLVANGKNS